MPDLTDGGDLKTQENLAYGKILGNERPDQSHSLIKNSVPSAHARKTSLISNDEGPGRGRIHARQREKREGEILA